MAVSVKKLFDDLVLMLNQSDISDDSALDIRQIKFWITIDANALITQEINSKLALGEMVPSTYVVSEECIIPELDDPECGGPGCTNRVVVELEKPVMTLNNDGGIIIVQTEDGIQVHKAGDIASLTLMNQMRFTRAGNANLLYYRVGQKLFIAGMKSSEIPFDKFFVWYVPQQNYDNVPDNTEVNVSDLVLPLLQASLFQRGKAEMYGSTSDSANDGLDPKEPLYHTAISNPENQQ